MIFSSITEGRKKNVSLTVKTASAQNVTKWHIIVCTWSGKIVIEFIIVFVCVLEILLLLLNYYGFGYQLIKSLNAAYF